MQIAKNGLMGIFLSRCMRRCCAHCCSRFCCCCCDSEKLIRNNSVAATPDQNYKVLLLGLTGSGKTEVGHMLSGIQRLDYEPTNGVKYFRSRLPNTTAQLAITEIGGNVEMQKIWHHYYTTAIAILYCFNISVNHVQMQNSFALLHRTLQHPFIRGKPLLLIATNVDQLHDGVQLYDIENAFQLEDLARRYACSLHLCCYGAGHQNANSLLTGAQWLLNHLQINQTALQMRVKCDEQERNWQNHMQKLIAEGKLKRRKYRRFPHKTKHKFWLFSNERKHSRRIRPHTAPSTISYVSSDDITLKASSAENAYNSQYTVPNQNSQSTKITDV